MWYERLFLGGCIILALAANTWMLRSFRITHIVLWIGSSIVTGGVAWALSSAVWVSYSDHSGRKTNGRKGWWHRKLFLCCWVVGAILVKLALDTAYDTPWSMGNVISSLLAGMVGLGLGCIVLISDLLDELKQWQLDTLDKLDKMREDPASHREHEHES